MLEDIKNYWQGKKSLWEAFWLLYAIPSMLAGCLFVAIWKTASFIEGAAFYNYNLSDLHNFIHLVSLFCMPYGIFCLICIWRCSKNSNIVFEVIAKLYVSIVTLQYISLICLLFIKPDFF